MDDKCITLFKKQRDLIILLVCALFRLLLKQIFSFYLWELKNNAISAFLNKCRTRSLMMWPWPLAILLLNHNCWISYKYYRSIVVMTILTKAIYHYKLYKLCIEAWWKFHWMRFHDLNFLHLNHYKFFAEKISVLSSIFYYCYFAIFLLFL